MEQRGYKRIWKGISRKETVHMWMCMHIIEHVSERQEKEILLESKSNKEEESSESK